MVLYVFYVKMKDMVTPDTYRITEIQGQYFIYNPKKELFLDGKGAYVANDHYYIPLATLDDALKIIELIDP